MIARAAPRIANGCDNVALCDGLPRRYEQGMAMGVFHFKPVCVRNNDVIAETAVIGGGCYRAVKPRQYRRTLRQPYINAPVQFLCAGYGVNTITVMA